MRALLIDEEAGNVESVADRPLRLLRAEDVDTGAAPQQPGAPSAAGKSASPATPALKDSASRRPPTPAAQAPNDGASRRLSMSPPSTAGAQTPSPGASPAKAPAPASSASARVEAPSAGGAPAGPAPVRVPAPRDAPPPAGAAPAGGTAVIPGVGPVRGAHVGATRGLVNGIAAHVIGPKPTRDAKQREIAISAHHDPSRYAPDLLLYTHNRKRFEELARARRLPSQVWAEYEANGQLARHLRGVHERHGEELRLRHRDRPTAERTIIGLAAATGTTNDVLRALDALRVHPHYPARVSFARLVDGFSAPEIARIAAAFLPGERAESVVEVYRSVREARERAHAERRRRLLRLLRAQWAMEQPAIVPLFEAITRGFSPAQVERLRWELERSGDVEAVFEQIEMANMRRRLDAVEAAFRRWLAEWEASRDSTIQTPMQEPFVLAEESPSAPLVEPPTGIDAQTDADRQLTIQQSQEVPDLPSAVLDEQDEPVDDAQGPDGEVGAPRALHAPPPGAYAADGVLPWRYITHGFGRLAEERLRRAWEAGRQWDVYREILVRRGAARMAAREAAFARRLEALGCALPGPCSIGREQLAVLAPLGADFTPEQWARLAEAVTEGVVDPLATWREIERENLAEAIAVREAAFLRYMGAWGRAPHWNPLDWTRAAPRLGRVLLDQETAGIIDDLKGALGSVGSGDGRGPLAAVGRGIGALFGGGNTAGQAAGNALGGELGAFAEQAVTILTGRKTPTQATPEPSPAVAEAAAPVEEGDAAAVLTLVDQGLGAVLGDDASARAPAITAPVPVFDRGRALAQWAGRSRLGERIVRGLEGVGLTDLAAAVPDELLRVVAGRAPSSSDVSTWWPELTSGQGLDEEAEASLRRAIEADGPEAIERSVATYVRLLAETARAQRAEREALFVRILTAAQRSAGSAFDPALLPGGDPFVILSRRVPAWPRVVEAMKRGEDPVRVFREVEGERVNRLLRVDAPAWMSRMLAALWDLRGEAGWVADGEAGDPDEAGNLDDAMGLDGEAGDVDEAGAFGDDVGDLDDAGDAESAGDLDEVSDAESAGDLDEAGAFGDDVGALDDTGDAKDAGGADDLDAADPRPGSPPAPRPHPGHEHPRHAPAVDRPLVPPHRHPPHGSPRAPAPPIGRVPVRPVHRPPAGVLRELARVPALHQRVRFYDPFGTLRRHMGARAFIPAPLRPFVHVRPRHFPLHATHRPAAFWPFMRATRPRPLYHLSFARPMSVRELGRLVHFVPQLHAHGYGVLAEMAGLMGQARDVRGVDATTGEYLLLPGETLMDVAFKLVGDRHRWTELRDANPLRAEGDPRVRIPPSWFGYVPYSVPLQRVRELMALRQGETGEPDEAALDAGEADEAGDLEDAGDFEEAGAPRGRRPRSAARRRMRRPRWARGMGGGVVVARSQVITEPSEEEIGDEPEEEDAADPSFDAFRRYVVRRGDVRAAGTPDSVRATTESIAIRHGLWDGERWIRPRWWAELRDANLHKPVGPRGWWRDIAPGEELSIPSGWPIVRLGSSDGSDAGDIWSEFAELISSGAPARNGGAAPEDVEPRFSRNPTNRGRRANLTAQVYTVARGDWPQKIARKFGADRRRHWLTELHKANPHKPVDSGLGNWFALSPGEVINIPDAWLASDTGWMNDSDAGAPRQNLTTRTYAVVAGDGMQRIAQKLGAASRAHWFGELRDANPHKPMKRDANGKQLGWTSLVPGEIINIPDAWPDTSQLRPAPGGAPTPAPHQGLSQFPSFPGGAVPSPTAPPGTVPAAATVDPGTILRVQAILSAFRQIHPEAVVPRDFGVGLPYSPDLTGVLTPRTQQALASFQRWTNAKTGARLRTDGVLDPDTIAALDSFSAQALAGMAHRPPAPPAAGAAPTTPGDAPDPFAGQFKAPSDYLRNAPPGVQSGDLPPLAPLPPRAPVASRRPMPMTPPEPIEPVLNDLPDALQQYGIPGVPGLPGGAPHAPRPKPPRLDAPAAPPAPEVPHASPPPDVPHDAPAPAAKKSADDAVVPMVLTGLGILSGIFG